MDVYLAVASRRDERRFGPDPVEEAVAGRVLDAGRLAGSARNRQPWRFVVVQSAEARSAVARAVYRAELVTSAPFVVGLAVAAHGSAMSGFDAGRAAQNMLMAGWDEGLVSCPSGIADPGGMRAALRLEDGLDPVAVLSFGHPAGARRHPSRRAAADWSARARRLPLDDLVRRV